MQVTHGAKDQLWCSVGVGRSAAALGCGTPFSGVGISRDHGPVCPDISVLGERAMVPVPSSASASANGARARASGASASGGAVN